MTMNIDRLRRINSARSSLRRRRTNNNIFSIKLLVVLIGIYLLLLLVVLSRNNYNSSIVVDAKTTNEIEVTHEWKRIGPNDTIPAGVHVRMDLSTGEKFVKLLDDNNEKTTDYNNEDDTMHDSSSSSSSSSSSIVVIDNRNTKYDPRTVLQRQQQGESSNQQNVTQQEGDATSSSSSNFIRIQRKAGANNSTKQHRDEQSASNPTANTKITTQYNYDAMYRALSQLPDDEKLEIGLPKYNPNDINNVNITQDEKDTILLSRDEFEQRMQQIWETRQEQLRMVQETMIADTVKILRQRIESIQSYIDNPTFYINRLLEIRKNTNNNNNNNEKGVVDNATSGDDDDDEDINGGVQSDNIISILADLEYQLTDVDMTRDFYTMKGWPLLASLLSNQIHTYDHNRNNSYNSSSSTTDDSHTTLSPEEDKVQVESIIDEIQMYTAWILGTAVKNTGEFTPYIFEDITLISDDDTDSIQKSTTPIDLIIEQIQQEASLLGEDNIDDRSRHANRDIREKKLDKLLYCLGSFLRGNRKGQIHFGAVGGADVLQKDILQNALRVTSSSQTVSVFRIKVIQRVIQLVSDIIVEASSVRQKYDHVDPTIAVTWNGNPNMLPGISNAIIQLFTSKSWCSTVVTVFDPAPFVSSTTSLLSGVKRIRHSEIVLNIMASTMSHYCSNVWKEEMHSIDTENTNENDITLISERISSYISGWIEVWDDALQNGTIDDDLYNELLQQSKVLIDSIVVATATGQDEQSSTTVDNVHYSHNSEQQQQQVDPIREEL